MALNVVVGPPCAGKSTHVRDHASPGDVIVDHDALAVALGSDTPHQAKGDIRLAAFAARAAVIEHVLASDADAWIIHTSPSQAALATYAEKGATVTRLDPGIDTCLARAAERPDGTEQAIRDWYAADTETEKNMSNSFLKRADATVKAVGGPGGDTFDGIELEEGDFLALVSAFGNVDSYGDEVMPGAFLDTIKAHEDAGDPIPVVWAHQWADPFAHLGYVVKAWETPAGLMVHGRLDLDNPTAVQVHKLMKARRIREFSFAYDIDEAAWGVRKAEGGGEIDVYELRRLSLTEVGPCLKGVNRETDLHAVKGEPPPREPDDTDPEPDTPDTDDEAPSDEGASVVPETSPERKGDERPAPLNRDRVAAWSFTEALTHEETA